jgi:hypothetical protein
MSTNAIVSASTLDSSKVSFGDIRPNKAGGKSVPIKYNGQNLQIRLPGLYYPMGVNIKETENGTSYTMSATLKGCDSYAKDRATAEAGDVGTLYNFLLDLQEKLVLTATENSVKWFGKARKEEVVRDTMKMFVAPSVEKVNGEWVPTGKYPPSLRMKVPVYDGKVTMDVVNAVGNPIAVSVDNLQEVFPKRVDANITVVPSVYVSGQGFGVTWRITHARVSPPQRMTARDVFADEIAAEKRAAAAAPARLPQADEDEIGDILQEAEDQEEITVPMETPSAAAPAPAPAPAPAAKTNRRRVVAA